MPGQLLLVHFAAHRIAALSVDGRPVDAAELDPLVLATYYDDEAREKWPVTVKELPEHVVQAVLAAEDDAFYWHPGVSPTGIARALLVNLRQGEVPPGGQHAHPAARQERLPHPRAAASSARSARRSSPSPSRSSTASGASSRAISTASIWAAPSGIQYYGLGAAARAYFGKDATELTLPEAATLAGMIKSPAFYSPVAHPDHARQRRDEVLRRMAELELDRRRRPAARPGRRRWRPRRMRLGDRPAPHFADAMADRGPRALRPRRPRQPRLPALLHPLACATRRWPARR